MEGTWDLSWLYESFDDPRFKEDMAQIPVKTKELAALLEGELPATERLERICDAQEAMTKKVMDLFSFIQLTLAVDQSHVQAMQALGRMEPMMNELSLVQSAVTRYIGGLDDLEAVIAPS